jgi:hypothetical protein
VTATPRQPLDTEEASIARVYAALPSADPSPALDARILAHARAAVAKAPPKRRPWFLGAGLGTAAAAVFAAGIAWQLGGFKAERALSSVPEQLPAAEEEVERVDIEFVKQEQERKREDAAPPSAATKPRSALGETREQAHVVAGKLTKERDAQPFSAESPPAPPVVMDDPTPVSVPVPSTPAAAPAQDAAAAAPVSEAAAVLEPAPAPVPPSEAMPQDAPAATETPVPAPQLAPESRADADVRQTKDDRAAAGAGFGVDAEGELRRRQRESESNADTRAEPATAASSAAGLPGRAASNAEAARDELARSAQLAKLAGLPPWTEDAALAPEPWLERIRDRVQAGDRQSAEYSLRRFVLAHPDRRVPRDLQRLLVE